MNTPATVTPPPTVPGLRVEVLKVGQFRDMHGRDIPVTRADLIELAESYSPARYRAPVVIGHPKIEDNAWGVCERFEVEGDSLYAVEGRVDAQFAAFRDAGHYAERSLSYFMPDSPNNPTPGKKHVKHVGWLGGAAPAVTGLARLQGRERVAALSAFDPDDQHVVALSMRNDRRWGFSTTASILSRVRDWMIEKFGLESADQIIPRWEVESLRSAAEPDVEADAPTYFSQSVLPAPGTPATQGPLMSNTTTQAVDLAAREQQLSERELRIKQDEDRLAQQRADALRGDAVAFADVLIADGRLLPRSKPVVVELMMTLPRDQPVMFAGEDGNQQSKPAIELFRELLASAPKHIEFAERSGGQVPGDNSGTVDFAAAPGAQVDQAGLVLHQKALQYQQTNPHATYLQAVKACGG